MARPVYSTVFIREAGLTGRATYTVPAGVIAVVRDFDGYGNNIDPEAALFLVDDLTNGTFFQWQQSLASIGSPTHFQWQGRQVFHPGDAFHCGVASSVSAAFDVRVSGYLLTTP